MMKAQDVEIGISKEIALDVQILSPIPCLSPLPFLHEPQMNASSIGQAQNQASSICALILWLPALSSLPSQPPYPNFLPFSH